MSGSCRAADDAECRYAFVTNWRGNDEISALSTHQYISDHILLTEDPSADDDPALSVDGDRAFFASDRDGDWDIYAIKTERCRYPGRRPSDISISQLTDDPATDRKPAVSPDARLIAFQSDRTGTTQIYLANNDGSDVRQLTTSDGGNAAPTWSPKGDQIAFHSLRDGETNLYVMNSEGLEQRKLTDNTASNEFPSWSPDGSWLAFVSNRDGNPEIYLLDLLTSEERRITHDGADDLQPVWCGRQICFTSNRGGDRNIYIIDPEGGEPQAFIRFTFSDESSLAYPNR